MSETLQGGCLCGAVRYEIAGADMMASCHCTRCQRWTGTGGATVMVVPSEKFKLTAGEDTLKVYREEPFGPRHFCGNCGSSLFSAGGARHFVLAGTVSTPHEMTAQVHVQVAAKKPWDQIPEGAVQFPEFPPGM